MQVTCVTCITFMNVMHVMHVMQAGAFAAYHELERAVLALNRGGAAARPHERGCKIA